MASISPNNILRTDYSSEIKINAIPEYSMIRTGVQGKGSCYLQALFTDLSGREFRTLSILQRDDIVHRYRAVLAQNLSLEVYTSLLDGELAKLEVFQLLEKKWPQLYTLFPADIQAEYSQNPSLLKQMIHEKVINLRNIEQQMQNFSPRIQDTVRKILDACLTRTFESFKRKLADQSEYIDQYLMKYIDSKLNVNVLFIKPDGNLYVLSRQDCLDMRTNGLNFILVYYLDERHFESISRVEPNNTIVSYFTNNDPMIVKLLASC